MENISKHSFLIAFYSQKINGKRLPLSPAQPLLDFLLTKKAKSIKFIDQSVAMSDHECCSEVYSNGKLLRIDKLPKIFSKIFKTSEKRKKRGGTFFRLKIRDIISVLYFSIRNYGKYDYFIGSESVNTLIGIILKKIGIVKNVIYYVIDLGPDRYQNKIINYFYLKLDKICSYYSDFTWNNSFGYEKLRLNEFKYNLNLISRQINLSYGIDLDNIEILPSDRLHNQIVFNGSIDIENGIELIIEAAEKVIKEIPDIKFKLIGGGLQENLAKEKIRKLKLEDYIEITGYFFDREKIRNEFCRSKIGLAPYPLIKGSIKPYGDPIKLREYMACGLPIITTNITCLSQEIKNYPLGIIIDFNKESLANAIIKILRDTSFFNLCRKNVLRVATDHTWQKIFEKAFFEIGLN